TQMKATGEVMAIAPSFEQALMKAVRGVEISLDTLNRVPTTSKDIRHRLHRVNDVRIFTIFEALKNNISVDEINEITKIDKWFLYKIKNLADYELSVQDKALDHTTYIKGKNFGYTDEALRRICGHDFDFTLEYSYKSVDTCAAEFAADTPYFYATYDRVCESRPIQRNEKDRIIVLGSGPIRIGQGIEFDYSSVHCINTLKELGYEVIIINNNPETVSTDFDISDRLYFEPLCEEDVMNVINVEKPIGVVVAFGGQTAIKLTKFLHAAGINILGTSAESIDLAENRERFDDLLQSFNIKRPSGCAVYNKEEAVAAAKELGYPVLVRPSYVIGGQNMTIAYSAEEIFDYMDVILEQGNDDPVLIDQYLMGTELEVDVISDGEEILIPGIMQHIERAGVHSGDSIAVYPPYSLTDKMLKKVIDCSEKLALAIGTKGLVNIQFLIYHNDLYVIEVNPRASRTIPYISKVTGIPMVDIATRVMTDEKLDNLGYGTGLYPTPPYIAVKVPVFSFEKLSDVNTQLGPEMKSTGEVLGIGKTLEEALYKGLLAAGTKIPDPDSRKGGVLITVSKQDRFEIVALAKKLDDLGMKIYATDGTAKEIRNLGIDVQEVKKLYESNDMLNLLENDKIDFIVYTGGKSKDCIDDFIKLNRRALQLSVACLTSLDTANVLADIMASRFNENNTELIDINHMRKVRGKLSFAKMQSSGNDYIYVDNFDGKLECPESLAINLSNRHYGIGADGLVLIEYSKVADAKMRMFNKDGSESNSAGNSIRCVAKYLYDKGLVKKQVMSIETGSGINTTRLYIINGRVGEVTASIGKAEFKPSLVPVNLDGDRILGRKVQIAGKNYDISCVSVGNPHCVVFADKVDEIDMEAIGPLFENDPIFPERVNTEFVRFVNPFILKMRVWERGNGETLACGTGACAAVIIACEKGLCKKNEDITVKVKGGDLIVNYKDDGSVTLTGNADLIFEGTIEY
ncbi:MAG: carbamoyl-phosphate synthase large subunit, partial [Eubacteriales bacterium]|nr:carbamoyl-phosphate synthase large subunit [Eubacteriales bacterium]